MSVRFFIRAFFEKVFHPIYRALQCCVPRGMDSNMEWTGMLVGNLEFNPLKRPIWAWPKLLQTPKRDSFVEFRITLL